MMQIVCECRVYEKMQEILLILPLQLSQEIDRGHQNIDAIRNALGA
jgi:hypothetical protein